LTHRQPLAEARRSEKFANEHGQRAQAKPNEIVRGPRGGDIGQLGAQQNEENSEHQYRRERGKHRRESTVWRGRHPDNERGPAEGAVKNRGYGLAEPF